MFEFLKGYDENKLYDAGREIENQLHSKLVFAAMCSLSEAWIKGIEDPNYVPTGDIYGDIVKKQHLEESK